MQNATQTPAPIADNAGSLFMLMFWMVYMGCIACVQAHHREIAEKNLESEKNYSQWLQCQLRTHIDAHPTAYPPDANVQHIAIPIGPREDV